MKIEGVEPITNSQHRLVAENAKKHTSHEHAQTQQGKQMEQSAVRSATPAHESGKNQAQSRDGQSAQAGPQAGAGDRAALQAMASKVREEFAEAGVFPPPRTFAGVSLVSTAELAASTKGEKLSEQMGPMHQAKMAMVRQLVRRLSGKELSVMTPRELGRAQAWLEEQSRTTGAELAPGQQTDEAPLASDSWQVGGTIDTADGQSRDIRVTAAVEDPRRQANEPSDLQEEQEIRIRLDASSKEIDQSRFEFAVAFEVDDEPSADSVQVQETGAQRPAVLAVGARDSGAVYVGHLMGPDAPQPATTAPPARHTQATEDPGHLDLSI
jgi:hypothetical protein